MNQQIPLSIRILKRAHVPMPEWFVVKKDRTVQCIVPIDGRAGGYADIRIVIPQIIRMHQHDILSRFGTFHHLHPFSHAVRTENPVFLDRQDDALEPPVYQVGRRVATKAGKGIAFIRLILSKQPVASTVFHDTCPMRVDNVSLLAI